jgi:hypothetical protein
MQLPLIAALLFGPKQTMVHISPAMAFVLVGLGFLLVVWRAAKIRGFQREFQFEGEFPGQPYECQLRSTDAESPVQCRIGATDTFLYLMPPQGQTRKRWWAVTYGDFQGFSKTSLRIPWSDLQWRAGRMFFKEVIWFENRPRQFYVYVPRAIGEKVLIDAGRDIPV